MKQEGLRYNSGKLRHELIPTRPLNYVAEVYTKGAHKYSKYLLPNDTLVLGSEITLEQAKGLRKVYDGADNWRRGLSWRETIAAVKRHILAWEKGEDLDPELGTMHLANSIWGLNSILEFYTTHPELDDRNLPYLQEIRFGIDIDDVLADFIPAYCERFGLEKPKNWNFDVMFWERYQSILDDKTFWTTLKTIISPEELPLVPVVYITSRPEELREFTETWLFEVNKYPVAPVVFASSKVETCKEYRVDRFLDDKWETFVELNRNKIPCYLFDSSHNQRFDAGFRRITKSTLDRIIV